MRKEKEENLLKEKQNKEMIQKKYETGKKYEQELLEKLKNAPKKAKSNRKDWGQNNADALMEEKLKKIDEEKKSKEKNKEKKGIKENFTNLPQEKFEKVKKEKLNDFIGRKLVNKLGQTQNLEHLLSKKDKKTKDDLNKPPKPKRDMEEFLKKQAEIKEQFKK